LGFFRAAGRDAVRRFRSRRSNGDAFGNLGVKRVGIDRGDGGVEQFLGGVDGFGDEV
jgi:hypothetical protein